MVVLGCRVEKLVVGWIPHLEISPSWYGQYGLGLHGATTQLHCRLMVMFPSGVNC